MRRTMQKIQEIIDQINNLEKRLSIEIQKKEEEFFYKIRGRKVHFDEATRKYHKTLITKVHTYLYSAGLLKIIIAPLVWFCIIPAFFMDLVIMVFQFICFPVYRIPKVRRSDYIILDRHSLQYLNVIEKINCVYCGYINGLMSYVQEIAARAEQHWCPIKHARKVHTIHSRYNKFLTYGDGDSYKKELERIKQDFEDLD
jgi:hypothetical protein